MIKVINLGPVVFNNYYDIFNKIDNKTLIWYGIQDEEIILNKGFLAQHSAIHKNSYAIPYFWKDALDYINIKKNITYKFNFSFVGTVDVPIRQQMVNIINNNKLLKNIYLNYSTNRKQKSLNYKDYSNVLSNSKFIFCPSGLGYQSKRFYEAIMNQSIPIFIGLDQIKLPLEWVIDWDKAVFRCNINNLNELINNLIYLTENEYYEKLLYLEYIYNQYLSQIKFNYLLELIILNIKKNFKKI